MTNELLDTILSPFKNLRVEGDEFRQEVLALKKKATDLKSRTYAEAEVLEELANRIEDAAKGLFRQSEAIIDMVDEMGEVPTGPLDEYYGFCGKCGKEFKSIHEIAGYDGDLNEYYCEECAAPHFDEVVEDEREDTEPEVIAADTEVIEE